MADISLAELLAAWDGRSVAYLEEVFQRLRACVDADITPDFDISSASNSSTSPISLLVPLLVQPELQRACSWLIKKALESGCELSEPDSQALFSALPEYLHWEAQLHFLQSLPYCTIPQNQVKTLITFLEGSIQCDNKMVRAWSYNAWYLLACQYSEYQPQVKQQLLVVLDQSTEAASVKARIRNITKQKAFKAFAGFL